MDPVSLAIGVIGLPAALTWTFKSLRKIVKSIKYAKHELWDLGEEIDLFAGIYDDFLDACDEASLNTKGALRIKRHLISWTKKVMEGFENLLNQVQAAARDPRYEHSAIEVVTAHYRWIMSKSTLKYLRASLNVARQSMVAFTNIRVLGKLNEELAYLQSALTSSTERQSIESRHGITVEARIEIVQMKTRNRRTQRHEIVNRLEKEVKKVKDYKDKDIDHGLVPQKEPLLQFQKSVNRYVSQIVFQDRSERRARRVHDDSSVLTSQSTATTRTQSTQPSPLQSLAPESPPTSPEPIYEDSTDDMQSDEEDPISILNFCQKCEGTCTNTDAHNTSIPNPSPNPPSHTVPGAPTVITPPLFQRENNTLRPKVSFHLQIPPIRSMQPSSSKQVPPSNPSYTACEDPPAKPSIQSAQGTREKPHFDRVTQERDGDSSEDEESEEESLMNEQARGSRTSIWKATGGFEGDMPKGLRIRRQRSQSPQDFW